MSAATAKRLEAWFRGRRVFFDRGMVLPRPDVVCQRALVLDGAVQDADEAGIHPSSSDLIAAGRRAESSNPVLPGKNAG